LRIDEPRCGGAPERTAVELTTFAYFVPLTVVLEFEWVMRGFYEGETSSFCDAMMHLPGMRHVAVERWEAVNDEVNLHRRGLDFADALHCTSSAACSQLVSFDDRRSVRRARRLKHVPEVKLPSR
jgi:predicted nucleic-acid-binding protein